MSLNDMLRASCDKCHKSKVRCIFDEGGAMCRRCQQRRYMCVKSPSLPLGRVAGSTNTLPDERSAITCLGDAGNAMGPIMFPLELPWVDCDQMHFGAPATLSPASSHSTPGFFPDAALPPTTGSPEAVIDSPGAPRPCDCQSLVSAHLQSSPLVAVAFDATMMANGNALYLVQQLIRCPCLHPPSFFMVPYLLLHTALQLCFEAWWSWCRPVAEKSGADAGGAPAFVGSLRLSDEDSRLLRYRIVLQALEKVKQLQLELDEKTRDGRVFDMLHSFVHRSLAVAVERTLDKVSQPTSGTL